MSQMATTLDFYGGMNNVKPPHMLNQNEAAEIQNLYLDQDGLLKDINIPEMVLSLGLTLSGNIVKAFYWKPTKVPADCVDDFVYIVFYDTGEVVMAYREETNVTEKSVSIAAKMVVSNTRLSLKIAINPPDLDGKIGVTTNDHGDEAKARYYDNVVLEITLAPPSAGKVFLHWADSEGNVLTTNETLKIAVTDDRTVVAIYDELEPGE